MFIVHCTSITVLAKLIEIFQKEFLAVVLHCSIIHVDEIVHNIFVLTFWGWNRMGLGLWRVPRLI